MGFKKFFKKAVSIATNPVKAVAAIAGSPNMPTPDAAPVEAPQAAQIIEPPSKDKVDVDDDATTESGKKKAAVAVRQVQAPALGVVQMDKLCADFTDVVRLLGCR